MGAGGRSFGGDFAFVLRVVAGRDMFLLGGLCQIFCCLGNWGGMDEDAGVFFVAGDGSIIGAQFLAQYGEAN